MCLIFERISETPEVIFLTEFEKKSWKFQESCFWQNSEQTSSILCVLFLKECEKISETFGVFFLHSRNHVFDRIRQNFHGSLCRLFDRIRQNLGDSTSHVFDRIKNISFALFMDEFERNSRPLICARIWKNSEDFFLREFEGTCVLCLREF